MEKKTLVESAERYLEEDFIQENYEFYKGEMDNLLPVDVYGISIKLWSANKQTKQMDLNRECIKALEDFLKEVIAKNDQGNVEKFVDQTQS